MCARSPRAPRPARRRCEDARRGGKPHSQARSRRGRAGAGCGERLCPRRSHCRARRAAQNLGRDHRQPRPPSTRRSLRGEGARVEEGRRPPAAVEAMGKRVGALEGLGQPRRGDRARPPTGGRARRSRRAARARGDRAQHRGRARRCLHNRAFNGEVARRRSQAHCCARAVCGKRRAGLGGARARVLRACALAAGVDRAARRRAGAGCRRTPRS